MFERDGRAVKLRLHDYDRPYACFAPMALTMLVLSLVRRSYTEAEWTGGAGAVLLLFMPFLLASLLAAGVGIVLSLRVWRHWPLLVLGAASVVAVVSDFVPQIPEAIRHALPLVYGVGATAVCALWFLVGRWWYLQAEPPRAGVSR
jgi:hypothetical protein